MSEVRIRLQAPARLGAEENPARPGDEQTAAGLGDGHAPDEAGPRILYCHCAYAKVVPEEVKRDVLARLTAAGVAFDAVADLCEMSARRDPALGRIASTPDMRSPPVSPGPSSGCSTPPGSPSTPTAPRFSTCGNAAPRRSSPPCSAMMEMQTTAAGWRTTASRPAPPR